jgi:hypothetical protein
MTTLAEVIDAKLDELLEGYDGQWADAIVASVRSYIARDSVIERAVVAGCSATGTVGCNYPSCDCKKFPREIRAALASIVEGLS